MKNNIVACSVSAAMLLSGSALADWNGFHHEYQQYGQTTVAVIGDAPYGGNQPENIDELIDVINADEYVDLVVHLGDTKSGSTVCSDDYLEFIRDVFNRFDDPLFYTPGDNEWTDCHRDNNGDYNPVGRLEKIREIYFSKPGKAFGGKHKRVSTQKREGFPENQTWRENGVQIGLVHVVGSNNGLQPWALGDDDHDLPAQREAEFVSRNEAAVRWINHIFDQAERKNAAGVMMVWHGDAFAVFEHSGGQDMSGTDAVVRTLAVRSRQFEKPVLLVNGDTHDYYTWKPLSDDNYHPLALDYLWRGTDLSAVLSTYYHGVGGDIDNLTQVVFEVWDKFAPEPVGFGAEDFGWLAVTIDPNSPEVFSVDQRFVDVEAAD